MAPLSKWIDGLAADGTVRDAARVSLEARLATVAYWLPLAARPVDEDTERIHQLRVSTRRAIAALKLYRDWLPKGKRRWFTKRLKEIRQTVGNARDLDVMIARLHHELPDGNADLLIFAATQRAAVQPDVIAIATRCGDKNRFQHKTYRLLDRIEPRGDSAIAEDDSFQTWAHRQLRQIAEPFFAAEPSQAADWSALHQFRIRGKKLRYTMELVAPAFGPEFRDKLYPLVQKLQEKLGAINDFVVGSELLRRWAANSADTSQKELLETLIRQHESSRDRVIEEFRAWWTAERAETLRKGLLTTPLPDPHPTGKGLGEGL